MTSCVWRHASRRASSGCAESGTSVVEEADGGPQGAWAVILLRRVSGRPGAEGAPLEGRGRVMGICWRVLVLVVSVGLLAGGAMRRDLFFVSFLFCWCIYIGLDRWAGSGGDEVVRYIPLWR